MGRHWGRQMNTKWIQVLIVLTALISTAGAPLQAASKDNISDGVQAIEFARELGATLPPKGWVRFCQRHPIDCAGNTGERLRVKLDAERWQELSGVNTYVNRSIKPATDLSLYKVEELWTYPKTRGDCEDYVLLKRQHLLDLGWPREALLITVVLDAKRAGHAVLTVMTDMGEFVLDNQHPKILPWTATGYQFVKRQAQIDPTKWVALDPIASSVRRFTSSGRKVGGGR